MFRELPVDLQNNTPCRNKAPCRLMMGRALCTRLDFIRPNLDSQVQQAEQKQYHDNHSRVRIFAIGDKVIAKNFQAGPKWVQGTIVDCLSSASYQVKVFDGMLWRRHVDHLQHVTEQEPEVSSDTSDELIVLPDTITSESLGVDNPDQPTQPQSDTSDNVRQYPQRVRHPPQRYQDGGSVEQ